MLNRADFSYETTMNGFILYFCHHLIGARLLTSPRRFRTKEMAENRAEQEIALIMSGQGAKYYTYTITALQKKSEQLNQTQDGQYSFI